MYSVETLTRSHLLERPLCVLTFRFSFIAFHALQPFSVNTPTMHTQRSTRDYLDEPQTIGGPRPSSTPNPACPTIDSEFGRTSPVHSQCSQPMSSSRSGLPRPHTSEMEKLLPSTTPKPDPLKVLLQGMADSFARAYGIQAETAQGLMLAVFFVVVIAVVWPIALRIGMDGAAPFSTDTPIENATPAVSPLHEQLATLANENRTLRSALERIAVRLDTNERHCAELQAKLESRSSKKED